MPEDIIIRNAKVNNLKSLSVDIPRGKFVVVSGVSGSGKSSLVFDTLFAEGQRRFAESLSSYARQFLGRMNKPDVEHIDGIPPAIAIEQKVTVRNPRSTVATVTEIYDYLRIMYARIGRIFSPVSGIEVKCHTVKDVLRFVMEECSGAVYMLADPHWKEASDKVELLLSLKEEGYSRMLVENVPVAIDDMLSESGGSSFPDNALLVVDRMRIDRPFPDGEAARDEMVARISSSAETCFRAGDGRMSVMEVSSDGGTRMQYFSEKLEADGITFTRPDEYLLSFNSPLGACPHCGGLGKIIGISEDLVIPDKTKSIYDGAIACWRGEKMGWFKDHLVRLAPRFGIDAFKPYCDLPQASRDLIWQAHSVEGDEDSLIGINEFFGWVEANRYKIQYKYMLSRFSGRTDCPDCKGTRLRKEALYVKVAGKNIAELLAMTVTQLLAFLKGVTLDRYDSAVAGKALVEVISRLECLEEVGLGYLTLDRACNTLSGGESQRISLVKALGSSLVGSMYILDEPSIGLHPRDTQRLIGVMKRLRDAGNSVIVVEHDEEIIRSADMLIDLGPGAGRDGGRVVFSGSLPENAPGPGVSLTADYILGRIPRYQRKKRPWQYGITVCGAREHNLAGVDVKFPLGALVAVAGVSGSGKSSLVGDVLYPALQRRLSDSGPLPGVFSGLKGNIDRLTRVEYIDQNPIGRSSRSNAVTYLKIYDDIRKLFSSQQYARINGYTPSVFSFNQEGGRCPDCQGEGVVHIGMQFMADVTMVCETCGGKRFKPDVLEVRYRGKNIDDILNMDVSEAIAFFGQGPEPEAAAIVRRLRTLSDVGLEYLKLGQSSSTLSGGESQRIKLAYFLTLSESKENSHILFIFDEPTTGLHFKDVEVLLRAFDALLDRGHSIIVVEHNPDVIKASDWVIELGPEAGADGGRVVFEGTPEDLVSKADTHTSRCLRSSL